MKLQRVFLIVMLVVATANISLAQNASNEWKPGRAAIMTKWAADVSPENAWKEYPRPQMVREKWINLNGLWNYAIRPKAENIPSAYDGKILVPFAIESALSGVQKTVGETNVLWYKKTFDLPADWKKQNVVLNFEAVDWETNVWVNGKSVGSHKGGYDHFSFDITKYLIEKGPQEIILSVWDPTDTGMQPHGKQVKKPGGIWYTSVTGIWQTVWLECVPETSIQTISIIPDIDKSVVKISSSLTKNESGQSVEAVVLDGGKNISKKTEAAGKEITLNVSKAKLWTPDFPFLYDLKVYLKNNKGEKIDSVSSYFGMRKSSLGKDEKGITRMMLNNKFVFQFGPLDQGWWPDGLYTAPTDEALRYDIEMTKKMGFNLARKHVKVEPERWYYWCDKLGLLVWQDMPSGDKYIDEKDPDIKRTQESSDQLIVEMKELIKEKFNHPSIVMWVPYNEGWGQWNTEGIVKMFLQCDPTRLVDNASGWSDRKVGSVNDMHMYPGPGMPALEKKRAVVLGEFGGLGLPLEGHTWQSKNNWGYKNFKDKDDLANSYSDLIVNLMQLKKKGLSAAVYTQTTDVEVEVNGLMTYDRAVVKMGADVIAKINAGFTAPIIESESNLFIDLLKVKIINSSPSGEVHYTVDGSEPTKSSPLYSSPVIIKNTSTIKAKTFWSDGTISKMVKDDFTKVEPAAGLNLNNLKKGLKFDFYKNKSERWKILPDWKTFKTDSTGIIDISKINLEKFGNDFGLVFSGYFKAPVKGVYTFYISTDDGSNLFINDKQLIGNDGVHGMRERKGDVALMPGYHKIIIEYFQGVGDKGLELNCRIPGKQKQKVSSELLFTPKEK